MGNLDEPKASKRSKQAVPLPATVTIEEDYLEFHGQIYYAWRADGAQAWNFKLTPYKELPYIRWSKLTEVEYTDRLRRYGMGTDLIKNSPDTNTRLSEAQSDSLIGVQE